MNWQAYQLGQQMSQWWFGLVLLAAILIGMAITNVLHRRQIKRTAADIADQTVQEIEHATDPQAGADGLRHDRAAR